MLLPIAVAVASAHIALAADSLRSVHLHGIVRDSSSGAPLAGVTVVIRGSRIVRRSASDGRFDVDHLAPGTYGLGFRLLGYRDRQLDIALVQDTTIEVFLLPLGVQTEPVVVEASRPGGHGTEHVEQLDTRKLDRHRGQTFGELIEQVPQVSLLQTGAAVAKPVIRGFHSQRVLITSNGIPHQAQEWGLDHAPALDPFLPASIAIVTGAASIEDSYAAVGGIVRIEESQLAFHRPWEGKLSLVGASNNGMAAASVLVKGSDALVKNTAYLLQGSAHIAGDSRTPGYVLSNTGSRQLSSLVTIGYDAGSWQHSVSYSFFATELGILAAAHVGNAADLERAIANGSPLVIRPWTYTIGNPRQEIMHQTLHVTSTYSGDNGTLEIRYGWQRNDRSEYDAHNARYRDSAALQQALQKPAIALSLATYQLEVRYRQSSSNGSTTFGVHFLRQSNIRSGNVYLVPDYLLYEGGLIGIHTRTVGAWILSAGIRSDFQWMRARPYDRTRGILEPDSTMLFAGIAAHCGAERLLGTHTRIQINLASHWRPPSAVELYANDLHHGTAQYEIGDRHLGVERSVTLDLHMQTMLGNVQLDLSGYATYFPRWIQLLPEPTPTVTYRGVFPTMRYTQRRAAFVGSEASCSVPLTTAVRLDAQLAIVRGFDPSSNEWLPFLPADRARIALHVHLDRISSETDFYGEFALGAVRRQTAVSSATFDYAPPPPGYATLDLTIGGTFRLLGTTMAATVSITNILDQPYRDYLSRYRYFALDPGRNITFRLTIPFGLYHPLRESSQ